MLPDVWHGLYCGGLKVQLLGYIIIHFFERAPRCGKRGDPLGASRIRLVAVGREIHGFYCCNELGSSVNVGFVWAKWDRLEAPSQDLT